MMRSMFSGVSGLRAHQTWLDIIGNNIANVNTVGFKASRATFQEVFSQTLRTAVSPAPGGGRGGINPLQVGLGMSIASIDVMHQRGSVQRTDNATDLAIDGEGFFALADGDRRFFTRAGNLRMDVGGYLTVPNGMKALGWSGDDIAGRLQATAQPINLANQFMAASATDRVAFQGNLDSRTLEAGVVRHAVTLFDSLGGQHRVDFVFTKGAVTTTTPPTTPWVVTVEPELGGAIIPPIAPAVPPAFPATVGTVSFNFDGSLLSFTPEPDPAVNITFGLNDDFTGADDIVFEPGDLVFDPERLTQYAVDTSVRAAEVSGYAAGSLTSLNIDNAGRVIGVFSNGQLNELALLSIAKFNNPSGLMKIGDNLFEDTVNAGFLGLDAAGVASRGFISPGTLEMSNVDLAKEFTDMIVAQRGFQANSRIITTSDEILQELVNIKR